MKATGGVSPQRVESSSDDDRKSKKAKKKARRQSAPVATASSGSGASFASFEPVRTPPSAFLRKAHLKAKALSGGQQIKKSKVSRLADEEVEGKCRAVN